MMKKRILSLLLSVCMTVSGVSTVTLASETIIAEDAQEEIETFSLDTDDNEYQNDFNFEISEIPENTNSIDIVEDEPDSGNMEEIIDNIEEMETFSAESQTEDSFSELPEADTEWMDIGTETAEEESGKVEKSSEKTEDSTADLQMRYSTGSLINPIYQDVIEQGETAAISGEDFENIAAAAVDNACDTYEQAGSILRNAMEQRLDSVQMELNFFYWSGDGGSALDAAFNQVFNVIVDEALLDTGSPTQGDYLSYQYEAMGYEGCVSPGAQAGPTLLTIHVTYFTTQEQEQEVDLAIAYLKEQLELSQKDDYEKIKSIYQWIVSNVKYVKTGDNLQYTAYGALINKACVCQGYAVLLYRLLEEVGLDSRVISGYGSDQQSVTTSHAWNIVNLFGQYYYLDATWEANRYEAYGDSAYLYYLHGSADWNDHYSDDPVTGLYSISIENCPKIKNIISADNIFYKKSSKEQTFFIDADVVYDAPLHYASDSSVITVDEEGMVTVPADVKDCSATITITADAIHDYDAAETTIIVMESVSISFWEDEECNVPVNALVNTCGSFSWETSDEESNFNMLYMKVDFAASRDVALLEINCTAPDGFSFEETELTSEYEMNFSSVAEDTICTFVVPVYPIYSVDYDDKLKVGLSISYDGVIEKEADYNTIPVTKNEMEGEIYYRDSFSEELTGPYQLRNISFSGLEASSTKYNHGLASICASLSAAVYKIAGMESSYKNLGFGNIHLSNFNSHNDQISVNINQVACAFATKKILIQGEIYTLVSVTIRGTVGKEWESNFDVLGENTARHAGFENANMFVKTELLKYLDQLDLDKNHVKLLITGHSRAAAVADLLTVDLNTGLGNKYVQHDNMYTYTFATPNSVWNSVKYATEDQNNIFNIMNMADVVCHVPGGYYSPGNNLYMNHYQDARYSAKLKQFESKFNLMVETSSYKTWKLANNLVSYLDCSLAALPNDYMTNHKKGFADIVLGNFLSIEAIDVLWDMISIVDKVFRNEKTRPAASVLAAIYMVDIINCIDCIYSNHAIETYICWMELISGPADYRDIDGYRNVTIKCPVDVSLYDKDGVLVTKIVNNEVVYSEGPFCSVIGEDKLFCLGDDGYRFDITGYDIGTMDVDIVEYDKDNVKIRQTNYFDIPVAPGETVVLQAGSDSGADGSQYSMELPDGTVRKADVAASGDMLDKLVISAEIVGNGLVYGVGNYTTGEKVSLTAVGDNNCFTGWYKNGELLSYETVYSFICSESETLEARFEEYAEADLSACRVELSEESFVYDGTAKKAGVSVYYGERLLTEGVDYIVSYSNYWNAGTVLIWIDGINGCTGSISKTYEIAKAEQTISAVVYPEIIQPGGRALIDYSGIGSFSFQSQNPDVVTVNEYGVLTGLRTGTATIKVACSGDINHNSAEKTVTVYVVAESEMPEMPDSSASVDPSGSDMLTDNKITVSNKTLTYSKKKQSVAVGASALGDARLTYTSNNRSVSVTGDGMVTVKEKFIGKAVITIYAAETSVYKSASASITVTVNPTKTKLSAVKRAGSGKLTVKWKKNKTGSGYQIQYSTSKKFNKNIKTITIKKNKTTRKTIKGLKKGKTYYIRMRTFKTVSSQKYYSAWSSLKKIKMKK